MRVRRPSPFRFVLATPLHVHVLRSHDTQRPFPSPARLLLYPAVPHPPTHPTTQPPPPAPHHPLHPTHPVPTGPHKGLLGRHRAGLPRHGAPRRRAAAPAGRAAADAAHGRARGRRRCVAAPLLRLCPSPPPPPRCCVRVCLGLPCWHWCCDGRARVRACPRLGPGGGVCTGGGGAGRLCCACCFDGCGYGTALQHHTENTANPSPPPLPPSRTGVELQLVDANHCLGAGAKTTTSKP